MRNYFNKNSFFLKTDGILDEIRSYSTENIIEFNH